MMSCVFLKKSNIIWLVLIPLLSNAQYQIIAKSDLNLDKNQDIIYKDSITNKLIFEYAKPTLNKKDSILFFSNYNADAGSVYIENDKLIICTYHEAAKRWLDWWGKNENTI